MVSQNARRDKVARVSLIAGTVALICAGTSARSNSASLADMCLGRRVLMGLLELWICACTPGLVHEQRYRCRQFCKMTDSGGDI